jgi:hypothetical protein
MVKSPAGDLPPGTDRPLSRLLLLNAGYRSHYFAFLMMSRTAFLPRERLSRRALEGFSLEVVPGWPVDESVVSATARPRDSRRDRGFLKAQEVWPNYTTEDLERERAAFWRLDLGS